MAELDDIETLSRRLGEALAGRYELDELIGRGGMAYVFRAHDLRHDRHVAVKVLKPELASAIGAERFLREIRTTAAFAHPHILTLIDSGAAGDLFYYVMPYIAGESLRQKISREKQLSLSDTIRIARDVASALSYAHERGVIHRDMKPENILLHEGNALVTDFGIALAGRGSQAQRLTEAGSSLGTPAYMSPEQATADREIDNRSDVYSLGCVVYEMLTGEPPHLGATSGATLSKMMTERPTAISVVRDNVPPPMERAVMCALAKVPGDRFASTEEFAHALEETSTTPTPVSSSSFRKGNAGRYTVPLAAMVLFVVGAAAILLRWDRSVGAVEDSFTRQLTFTGDAEYVALSPDGTFFAYLTNGRRTLNVQDLEGGGVLALYESDEPMGIPSWNRSGTRILFGASVDDQLGLFTISRLGGSVTRRASVRGRGVPNVYAFGNTDSTIVTACCRGKLYVGSDPSIVLIERGDSTDGQGMTDVRSVADVVVEVAPSPDGQYIAFIGGFPTERVVVAVVPVGGAEPTVISSRDGSWFESERLAFSSLRWAADNQLFFAEQAGAGVRVVSVSMDRRGHADGPAWTVLPGIPAGSVFDVDPGANRLVYAGGSERSRLVLVEHGSRRYRPLGTGTYTYRYPRISPDGAWLAYRRGAGEQVELMVVSLPDGEPRAVLAGRRPQGPVSWSPRGDQFAAMVAEGSESSIYVIDARSGVERKIADGAQSGRMLWSSSGDELTFIKQRVGPVSVRISDGGEVTGGLSTEISRLFQARNPDRTPQLQGPPPDQDSLGRGDGRPPPPEMDGSRRIPALVAAPDGQGFVTYLGGARRGSTGLSIVYSDGSTRQITESVAYPLVWNSSGRIFFVDDGVDGTGSTHVHSVMAVGGQVEAWLDLPFGCGFSNLTLSNDGSRAVCAVSETVSDVWLISGIPDLVHR